MLARETNYTITTDMKDAGARALVNLGLLNLRSQASQSGMLTTAADLGLPLTCAQFRARRDSISSLPFTARVSTLRELQVSARCVAKLVRRSSAWYLESVFSF
jgi:hypothetical protein